MHSMSDSVVVSVQECMYCYHTSAILMSITKKAQKSTHNNKAGKPYNPAKAQYVNFPRQPIAALNIIF